MTDGMHEAEGSGMHEVKGSGRYEVTKLGWFPHERLDVFHVALEFAGWVHRVRRRIPRAGLRNQLADASESIVLNICEAASRSGGSRRNQFEIAYGSAAECHGAVRLCQLQGVPGAEEALRLLDRIRRMLARLQ